MKLSEAAAVSGLGQITYYGIVSIHTQFTVTQGLAGYFRDSGFDQNTVRESGKR